jgi:hypothetical protein
MLSDSILCADVCGQVNCELVTSVTYSNAGHGQKSETRRLNPAQKLLLQRHTPSCLWKRGGLASIPCPHRTRAAMQDTILSLLLYDNIVCDITACCGPLSTMWLYGGAPAQWIATVPLRTQVNYHGPRHCLHIRCRLYNSKEWRLHSHWHNQVAQARPDGRLSATAQTGHGCPTFTCVPGICCGGPHTQLACCSCN